MLVLVQPTLIKIDLKLFNFYQQTLDYEFLKCYFQQLSPLINHVFITIFKMPILK